jgi:protein N-terminal methyltransferase
MAATSSQSREITAYSPLEAAEAQIKFARSLDALLSPDSHGYVTNADVFDEEDVPDTVIRGLPTEVPSTEAFWRYALACSPKSSIGTSDDFLVLSSDQFYGHSTWFWTRKEMRVDDHGVMGGAVELIPTDVEHSLKMLSELRESRPSLGRARALDLGGGVGRVAAEVLAKEFATVDVADVAEQMLSVAKTRLGTHAGDMIAARMHLFDPPAGRKYDCIWMQWCLGYVMDTDLVALFGRLRRALAPGGVIVIKETSDTGAHAASSGRAFMIDAEDMSVTRGPRYWAKVISLAKLKFVKESKMASMPDAWLPVFAWVCE